MIQIGDSVVYCENIDSPPIIKTISKITPKGQIILNDVKARFKLNISDPNKLEIIGKPLSATVCEIYSVETYNKRNRLYKEYLENEQQQEELRKKVAKERKLQYEVQMKETKEAFENNINKFISQYKVLSDGNKFVVIEMPIHPKFSELKKYEIMIAKIIPNVDDFDYNDGVQKLVKKIQINVFYCNDKIGNFIYRGSCMFGTEEEALWQMINDLYHHL